MVERPGAKGSENLPLASTRVTTRIRSKWQLYSRKNNNADKLYFEMAEAPRHEIPPAGEGTLESQPGDDGTEHPTNSTSIDSRGARLYTSSIIVFPNFMSSKNSNVRWSTTHARTPQVQMQPRKRREKIIHSDVGRRHIQRLVRVANQIVFAACLAFATESGFAQTLTDVGASNPSPGASDVVQFSTSGNVTSPDNLNYYTDNQVNTGGGEPGQTFTTGNNPGGYLLNSVAVKSSGLGNDSGITTSQSYLLHIYSISGSTATLIQTYIAQNVSFNDGDWLKWTGFSVPLAGNTTYAYSFGRFAASTGWEAMGVASGNRYANGEIALISPVTHAFTTGGSHGYDAVCDIGLAPITIPVSLQPTVTATNSFVGTPVTLTGTFLGSGLSYQWQYNSGAGFKNIVGANGNSLTISGSLSSSGTYQLVASNSYGSGTAAATSVVVGYDTTPPVVLRSFNIDANTVEIDLSKPLASTTATNTQNYAFVSGPAITAATLSPEGTAIWLTTMPLQYGTLYTLSISGLNDSAMPPNVIAANTSTSFTASPRQQVCMDNGWHFHLGDPSDVTTSVTSYPEIGDLAKLQSWELSGTGSETYIAGTRPDIIATHAGESVSFVQPTFNDSTWRALNLPHDWAVELPFSPDGDTFHGFKAIGGAEFSANNVGWYRHEFSLPPASGNKEIYLQFDGVYRNSLVWLNGHIVGRNVSGYSSSYFNITPYINAGGTNELVVRVDATRFEGWFYEGAGIYRHVWLTYESPAHVAQWGTFVSTTSLSGSSASLSIQTTLANEGSSALTGGTLTSVVYDATGNQIASVSSPLTLSSGQQSTTNQTMAFPANLWSPQSPYLYNLVTTVSGQNGIADIYNTVFGVRTVTVDPVNGVFLNGKHVEIRGMCNHQDNPGVGIAIPDRLQYSRVEQMAKLGANAYRTTHNEQSSVLLDACDRMGILVLDENRRIGTDSETLGELTRQIQRDRNHPSVFMWSLGNEEPLEGTSSGAAVVQTMQNAVHAMDSTRRCTIAMNNSFGSGFSTVIDVQGFNYNLSSMDTFHASAPAVPCIGTETSSLVGDRGVYQDDTVHGYVNAYDTENASVYWGETAEQWWTYYLSRAWSSGGFAWTGFDYRGEPTPYYGYLNVNSHFGVIDMCGFPKDIAYYYKANWTLKPTLHLYPHWNWSAAGANVSVWAYGNCPAVELFVNGASQGRQVLNAQGHVEWDNIPFVSGSIQAIGYNADGVASLNQTIPTAGAPAKIVLTADRTVVNADGADIAVVAASVVDVQGNLVPTASNEVNFIANGGTLVGVGNGDPSNMESDTASHRAAFNGLAQCLVRSTVSPGTIVVSASAQGLAPGSLEISTVLGAAPLPAPMNLAAVAGNSQVVTSWDVVPGATTYNVYRSLNSGGPYTIVGKNVGSSDSGWVDSSLTNGATYFYEVAAASPTQGPPSGEVKVTLKPMLTGSNIGTAGSWGSQGNVGSNAFDGNLSTFFDGPDASGDWTGIDLGSGTTGIVTAIEYCPRAGSGSRMVGGQFQGSNTQDFSSGVVTLFTVATSPSDGILTLQPITPSSPFRYFRYIGPTGSYCNVSEIEFLGAESAPQSPGNLSASTVSGTSVDLTWTNVASDTISSNITYSVSGLNNWTALPPLTPGASETLITGLSPGVTYDFVLTAANAVGYGTSNVASAATYTKYQQWKVGSGLPINLPDTTAPDGDGVPILIKFATGIPLGHSAAFPGMFGLTSDGNYTFTFNRLNPAPVTYSVEASPNLVDWAPLETLTAGSSTWTGSVGVQEQNNTIGCAVTVVGPVSSGTAGRLFLRLNIKN